MILQIINMIEKYPIFLENFTKKFFTNYKHSKAVILAFSFYLSNIAYDRLISGRLNLFFNKDKELRYTYEKFFLGLFCFSYDLTCTYNYYDVFGKLESEAVNLPSTMFWEYEKFADKFPELKKVNTVSSIFSKTNFQF